ncbi:MAG: NADH:flavin oxidoreductase/NADH oxidase [Corynebacterium sp.]|nr:NADH:flavin oxidoreductase/NADH oxidase [Corynebacterium sp.]
MNVQLLQPIKIKELVVPNRMWVPPMCQYQATDGLANDWHLMHYGALAAGGFGMIIVEATGVLPEGRITDHCLGLWNDEQIAPLRRIVDFAHAQGARIAIQLGHSGRKHTGSHEPVAPSPIAYPDDHYRVPRELSLEEIKAIPQAFADAARRAMEAGFDTVEIHAAHGYLLSEFLSPGCNERTDEYGGSLENRARLLTEVVDAVRAVLPDTTPLLLRINGSDWVENGITPEEARTVVEGLPVDFVDVTSGGTYPAVIPVGRGYQIPFSETVRQAGHPVGGVGLIQEAEYAESLLSSDRVDVVFIGRASLRDPHWANNALFALGVPANELPVSPSYVRGYIEKF